jgi:hypothetical protein
LRSFVGNLNYSIGTHFARKALNRGLQAFCHSDEAKNLNPR